MGFNMSTQLPYLVDGDKKIVQSNAIQRYLARKNKLCKYCGKRLFFKMFLKHISCIKQYLNWGNTDLQTGGETEEEKIRLDILENVVMDFRMSFIRMCYTDYVSIRSINFQRTDTSKFLLTSISLCQKSGKPEARVPQDAAWCFEAVLRLSWKQEVVCWWQGMQENKMLT